MILYLVGDDTAMFEAIHGSAPDIAGQNIANPSGLLNGAVMMLTHIGQREAAAKIKNAFLCTIEEGIHTADIYRDGVSKQLVGTKEFADAIIERLGKEPRILRKEVRGRGDWPANVDSPTVKLPQAPVFEVPVKELVGCDFFVGKRIPSWRNGSHI